SFSRDWSSDVCSSDLNPVAGQLRVDAPGPHPLVEELEKSFQAFELLRREDRRAIAGIAEFDAPRFIRGAHLGVPRRERFLAGQRSEERRVGTAWRGRR